MTELARTAAPSARRALLAPARVADLVYTLVLVGPLALMVVAFKAHKLLVVEDVDVSGFLAGLGADLGCLALLSATIFAIFWLCRPGPARAAARVVAHVLVLGLSLLAIIEHGFFLTTGSLLDAYVLGYGLEHIGALRDVYLSEIGPPVYLGAALVIGANLLPISVARWRARRADPAATLAWRRGRWWAAAAAATVALGVLLAQLPMPAAAEPLRDNVFVSFVDEALAADDDATDDASLAGVPVDQDVVIARHDAAPPTRNVVIIILESARARSTTPYAPDLATTPRLADLAARGLLVEQAWTVVPHTSKALVSILCGIHPKIDQPIEEAAPDGLPSPCLPRLLADRGWDTAFFQPATRRFEERAQLVGNMGFQRFVAAEDLPEDGFERSSYFGFEDDAMLAPTLDWMEAADRGGRPFAAAVLTLASHHKYSIPKDFPRRSFATDGELNNYLNALAYVDRFVGKLVDGMAERDLLDDTAIVIVGDHGEGFGEHGRRQHDTVIYEEGLHVPLVVVAPGVAPARVTGLRQTIDIAPTLLELLGYDVVRGLAGRSLRDPDGHARLYAACWYRGRCMAERDGDVKLVYHFDRRDPEVFDLAADPLEARDLVAAGAISQEDVAARVERVLAWKAATNARFERRFELLLKGDYVSREAPVTSRPMDIRFGDKLRLVGVDVERTELGPDDPLVVTYHWEVLAALGDDWRLFTHVLGLTEGTKKASNADHVPLSGRYPTSAWEPGLFISDRHVFSPIKPLPPGTYDVVVGLYDKNAKGIDARAIPTGTGAEIDGDRRAHVARFTVR